MIHPYGRSIVAPPFVSWSPTIAAGVGTITSLTVNAARTYQLGNFVFVYLDFTITNNGTGSGFITCTTPAGLPSGPSTVLVGREVTAGAMLQCVQNPGSFTIVNTSNGYPGATGARLIISGTIEL